MPASPVGRSYRTEGPKRPNRTAPTTTVTPAPTRGEAMPSARADQVDHERAYVVLRSARRALLRAQSEAELLDLLCRIAVDEAGYRFAWVGFAEDDSQRTVRPVAWAGDDAGYVGVVKISWADTSLGRGPLGTAIRSGRPAVGRSFLDDPELAPWREEAIQRGFASVVGLPLRADGAVIGALGIYAPTPDAFSPEDVELLASLADDLSYGITMHRVRAAAEVGLRRSERNLADAQRIAHIGSWEWDLATGEALRSEETHRIFGIEPGAFAGTTEEFLAFVHPDDRARVLAAEQAAIRDGVRYDVEFRIVRPDGNVRIAHEEGEVFRDASGTPLRMVGTIRDITERIAADEERARLALAVEQTADVVWVTDVDHVVTYVNRSFVRVYGYEPDEVVGRHAEIVDSGHHALAFFTEILNSVSSGGKWSGALVNRRKDGTLLEVETVISAIRDAAGQFIGYMQTDRDVTRERELENALERDARERETIEAALSQIDPADAPEAIAATACAHIVRLPEIDSAWVVGLGGDQGRILAAEGRVGPVLAAGSLVPSVPARRLAERAGTGPWSEIWRARPTDGLYGQAISASGLHSAVYAPLKGPNGVVGVIAFGVHDAANAERIIERLPALATFGSIVGALVTPGIAARHLEDDVRASVQAILDASAFTSFFQPIIEFHTRDVVGYEALSRFDNGLAPDIVFRMAARAGLGIELEKRTAEAAIKAAAALPANAYLSLNVSPALIRSGDLRPLLRRRRRATVVEITEHVVIEDYPALRDALAALGPRVRVAVDDAGAGYASLRHVLELAPDFVKLDIALIRGIDADPARQALIAGMGYFAIKRKVRLIAEGIETPAELRALRALAIGYGQGYLLGRPQDGRGPGPWPERIDLPRT